MLRGTTQFGNIIARSAPVTAAAAGINPCSGVIRLSAVPAGLPPSPGSLLGLAAPVPVIALLL
ncbi:MAG: hypothetical protein GXY67_01725 [Clostridiales bacterium]|nr:hypothetical protein [Clostridiales bacterium]